MAHTVQSQVERATRALIDRDMGQAGVVGMTEPRVNALEIVIDEHAIRTLVGSHLRESEARLIVSTIKVNNDLERIGDLAVNVARNVIALAHITQVPIPHELKEMAERVRQIVVRALGALIDQNTVAADEVLSEDIDIDDLRNRVADILQREITRDPGNAAAYLQMLYAARHLERIGDHCTNIAEDVIYWVGGVDVRHTNMRKTATSVHED